MRCKYSWTQTTSFEYQLQQHSKILVFWQQTTTFIIGTYITITNQLIILQYYIDVFEKLLHLYKIIYYVCLNTEIYYMYLISSIIVIFMYLRFRIIFYYGWFPIKYFL